MTPYMCTYAFDTETVIVFNFDLECDEMEEAIGEALYQIGRDSEQPVSALVGFSVLRLNG